MHRRISPKDLLAFIMRLLKANYLALCLVFLLSLFAAISQAGIFFILFQLFKSDGNGLTLFGLNIPHSTMWIILIGFAITAAFAPYASERFIIRRTIRLFKDSLGDFAARLSQAKERNFLLRSGYSIAELTRLMSSETRYASLAYSSILRSVFPLVSILVYLGVMFWLNAIWTLVIVAAFLPFVIWQFFVLKSGMQINRDLRDAATSHSRYVSQFIGSLSVHFTSNRWGDSLITDFDKFVTGQYPDTFERRLKLGISLRLISDMAIVGLVLGLAFLTTTKQINLVEVSYIIIFAILVRFVHSNLDRAISNFVGIISQLPYYSLYISTLKLLTKLDDEEQHKININVEPGQKIVYTSDQINWGTAGQYISSNVKREHQETAINQSIFLTSRYGMIKSDFIATLQFSPKMKKGNFDNLFPYSSHRWPAFEKVLTETNGELDETNWKSVPAIVKFLSSVSYGLKKKLDGKIVFINGLDLNMFSQDELDWLFYELSESNVVIFYSNPLTYRTTPKGQSYYYLNSKMEMLEIPVNEDTGLPELSDIKHAYDTDRLALTAALDDTIEDVI